MDYKLIFGVLSSVIAIGCYLPYFRDILSKKTQPHMYSWLVWVILQIIAVVAQINDGAGYGSWALIIGSVFCFLVFLLSFFYGTKNISRFDLACLVSSIAAIGLYIWLNNPLWSVILITLIDFAGFLPTFRKGYEEPESETISTFLLSALANGLSIIALQYYSIVTVLYIASLLLSNGVFVIMLYIPRRSIKCT